MYIYIYVLGRSIRAWPVKVQGGPSAPGTPQGAPGNPGALSGDLGNPPRIPWGSPGAPKDLI